MEIDDTKDFELQPPQPSEEVLVNGDTIAAYLLQTPSQFRRTIVKLIPQALIPQTKLALLTVPHGSFTADHTEILDLLSKKEQR
jgi:hypothetical protein